MKTSFFLLTLFAVWTAFAEVELEIQPDPPLAGEPFQIVLTSSKGRPSVVRLPRVPGLQWFENRASSGYRNINGRASYSTGFAALADKPGNYEVPPFDVKVGRKTEKTRPVTIRVAAGESGAVTADDGRNAPALFAKMRLGEDRRKFYLGEEVPLLLDIYVRPDTQVTGLAYPELNIPHAVYHDYRRINPENSRFAKPTERVRTVGGVRYVVVTLRTAFRSLAAGEVTPEASTVISVARRARRERVRDPFWDDDFFAGAFSRTESVQRKLVFESPGAITFEPLPPVPQGVVYTGLVGPWQMHFDLDPGAGKVGEIMTLKLRLSGGTGDDQLNLPKLDLPGFRVYPPEIRRSAGTVDAAWQIIPLKPGKHTLRLALATFDPVSGEYQVRKFTRELAAAPADRPADNAVAAAPAVKPESAVPETAEKTPDPVPPARTTLLYLAKTPGPVEHFPLGTGMLGWYLALFVGGPLVWAVAEFAARRRERLSGSESLRRRKRAGHAARTVLAHLKAAGDEEAWNRVMSTEVPPLLADRFDLPPGCTALEVAEKITDPELARALTAAGQDAYLPGHAAHGETDRKAVLRALKKLFLVLLLPFAALTLSANDFADAGAAYDRGDFARAEAAYRQILQKRGPAAGLLYNLGCAAYMNHHPAAALAYFDSAVRLAPRDSAALENLNVARARLGLPAEGRVESPRDLLIFCRDVFRPDGWLLLAAAAWCAAFLLLACRRILPGTVLHTALGTVGLLFLAALLAYGAQVRGPYAADRAVVLDDGAAMRALPTESGAPEGGLSAGQEVRLLEERGDHALVRRGSLQGWIPRRACLRLPAGR